MSSSCLHCQDVYYFMNSIVSEVISYLQGTLHHVWMHLHIILRSNVPGLAVSLRWILDHRLVQTLCLCNVFFPKLHCSKIIPNWNHNLHALVIQTETQSAHTTNPKWYIICTHSGTIFYACHTAMVHIWYRLRVCNCSYYSEQSKLQFTLSYSILKFEFCCAVRFMAPDLLLSV